MLIIFTNKPQLYQENWHLSAGLSKMRVHDVKKTNPSPIGKKVRILEKEDIRSGRFVLCDVDLGDRNQIVQTKALLEEFGSARPPILVRIDPAVRQNEIQAANLRANITLPRKASRDKLIATIRETLGLPPEIKTPSHKEIQGKGSQIEAHVTAMTATLDNLFGAVRTGAAISPDALSDAAEDVLNAVQEQGLQNMLDTIWQYDDTTYQHCLLVATLASAFSLKLGFNRNDKNLLTRAALIHDIGKGTIPNEILNKPAKLTAEEFKVMKTHTTVGYDKLAAQGSFSDMELAIVRSHHEYLDGSGYPDGLAAANIPDIVRLITITDIHAALIERRPYKQPMSTTKACEIMGSMTGKLDMDLLEAFKPVVQPVV